MRHKLTQRLALVTRSRAACWLAFRRETYTDSGSPSLVDYASLLLLFCCKWFSVYLPVRHDPGLVGFCHCFTYFEIERYWNGAFLDPSKAHRSPFPAFPTNFLDFAAFRFRCVVVLCNAKKTRQSHIFNVSKKAITSLAFSGDGKHLVTGEVRYMRRSYRIEAAVCAPQRAQHT